MENKLVLDATCGSRMIWFNKNNEIAVFVDKRELDTEAIWTSRNSKSTRYCSIHPDVIADFTKLPEEMLVWKSENQMSLEDFPEVMP